MCIRDLLRGPIVNEYKSLLLLLIECCCFDCVTISYTTQSANFYEEIKDESDLI